MTTKAPAESQNESEITPLDHFIRDESGNPFAGRHLIIDFHEVASELLVDARHIEQAFTRAAKEADATLLSFHQHKFEPNGGISAVAVLAESHISVHTWPERNFAAFDIFMCGNANTGRALEVLREEFNPGTVIVQEFKRGLGKAETIPLKPTGVTYVLSTLSSILAALKADR
jgi:S-adenosylmethionine decarboxylase